MRLLEKIQGSPPMKNPKRTLPAAQKCARQRQPKESMTIFIHGKQKRVRRPLTIDGLPVDEFIRRNADLALPA